MKSVKLGRTGPVSPQQFAAVLDIMQDEAADAFEGRADQDRDEDEDEGDQASKKAKTAKKAVAKDSTNTKQQPSAATVAASAMGSNVIKNENYDFSNVYSTLDEVKREKKHIKVDDDGEVSASSDPMGKIKYETFDDDDEEEEEDGRTEEEVARDIYDQLRGKRVQATVADFLLWDDLVDLEQRGAINKLQLTEAMKKVGIDVSLGGMTHIPFQKVRVLFGIYIFTLIC